MKPIFTLNNLAIIYSYGIVLSLFVFFWISYAIHYSMPTFIIEETSPETTNAFIGENAKMYLKALTDIGPKIVGSVENEEKVFEYINTVLHKIDLEKHESQTMKIDKQEIPSGDFYRSGKPIGYYYYYEHLKNIVVKISGKNSGESALLVNAHYDSVAESPGGSDDNIMIAVMLETLRVMSKSSVVPENDIIFLFNGAEEVGLLGSHAFITQHTWAPSCKVLVNLEATGAGGKAILFQIGPGNSWLMDHFADIPHPHAQVVGQELFETGVIPSDTDFRNFRDYGNMIGFDMAFYEDGYRYHNKYDGFDNIANEVYQHTGDNLLHLVQELSRDSELGQKYNDGIENKDQRVIYYDFIGLFLVHYDKASELALNICSILISIGTSIWCMMNVDTSLRSKLIFSLLATGFLLLSWVLSFVINIIVAVILDAAYRSMTWYAHVWIIFGLYGIPTIASLFSAVSLLKYFQKKKKSLTEESITKAMQAQMYCHIIRLFWTFVLFLGTCLGIKSCYILIPYILLASLGSVFVQVIRKQFVDCFWIPVYILTMILPTLFGMYLCIVTSNLIVPIMGRFGPNTNPDLIIGCVTTLFVILTTSPFVPLMVYSKLDRLFYVVMGIIFVIFAIIVATPAAFPFSSDSENPKPQRFAPVHSNREVIDENGNVIIKDSGFTFNPIDRQSPFIIEDYVSELGNQVSLEEDCTKAILCGMPTGSLKPSERGTIWIPTSEVAVLPDLIKLTSIEISRNGDNLKYSFSLIGPNRMSLLISPRKDVKINSISIISNIYDEGIGFNDQQLYVISVVSGQNPTTIQFSIEFVDNRNGEKVNNNAIVVGVTGIYAHKKLNTHTTSYQKFLDSFPDWAALQPMLSSHKSRVY